MKKTANTTNINTRTYWNGIYGSPKLREQYAVQGTDHAHAPKSDTVIGKTRRFETALGYVKKGDKVLDIGCGVGVFTTLVKDTHPDCEVWGTDISDRAIADNGVERPDIKYLNLHIGAQGILPRDYFDVVFSGETLEHLDDPNDLFKDARMVLRPGGSFVMTTPNEDNIRSPEHTWYFGHEDIIKLYQDNGFTPPDFVYLPDLEHLMVIFAVGKKL